MRASLFLLILLSSCTVVPTPTASGLIAGDPSLVGTWRTVTSWGSDSLVQRLALFSDGGYERGAVDSSPVTGNRVVLSEVGIWAFPTNDTTHIVFSPYSRQTWPTAATALGPAATTPDTARWLRAGDTLSLTLHRWYQRDSTTWETLPYTRD